MHMCTYTYICVYVYSVASDYVVLDRFVYELEVAANIANHPRVEEL